MGQPKRILVACGTAIATSTVVARAIEEALSERHIPVTIRQCKATEVPSLVQGMDLVVTTTPVPGNLWGSCYPNFGISDWYWKGGCYRTDHQSTWFIVAVWSIPILNEPLLRKGVRFIWMPFLLASKP